MFARNIALRALAMLFVCGSTQFAMAQAWNQKGQNLIGEGLEDYSGGQVSISSDGNTLAVGAAGNDGFGPSSGHVRIFEWDAGSWMQKGSDIDGEWPGDGSGTSLSLNPDGTIVAIGSRANSDGGTLAGSVRVFEWDGASWVQKGGDLDGNAGDQFGKAVSINANGDFLIVGAHKAGSPGDEGAARIYQWDGNVWNQLGNDILGLWPFDELGTSVDISADGHTVIVGVPQPTSITLASGNAEIYNWDGTTWNLQAQITGGAGDAGCGEWVTMNDSGTVVAIGSPFYSNPLDSMIGQTRVFELDAGNWVQKGNDIDGVDPYDFSGLAISLSNDGNIVAIGDGHHGQEGHARVFEWDGSSWNLIGMPLEGDGNGGGSSAGWSVDLSGDGLTIAMGDPHTLSFSTGQTQVYHWLNCTPNTGSETIVACDTYTWIDGVTYTASTNTVTHTLLTTEGCDSVVSLDLTINDCSGAGGCINLIFSEYIEGTANNKAIEIYNPTPAAVNLSDYAIHRYSDGASMPTETEPLTGTLAAGEAFVIAHAQANTNIQNVADLVSTITWFNGNDALELVHGGTPIDVIGAIGTNPGNSWPVGSGATQNHTLVRKFDITIGQLNWTVGSGEWDVLSQNDASNLGMHSMAVCCPTSTTGSITESTCNDYTSPSGNHVWNQTGIYTDVIGNAAGCDSIITVHLTINSSATTDVIDSCDPVTWIDGSTYSTSNSTATETLTNALGCDSVVTLNLTITEPDTAVQSTGTTLVSTASNATWQWLDCDNAFLQLGGETNASFTPSANGNFAVEVTQNGCTAISDCHEVAGVGVHQYVRQSNFRVFPNPTSGTLTIAHPEAIQINMRLTDVSGKLVQSTAYAYSNRVEVELDCPPGIYLLHLSTPTGLPVIMKIVKTAR